MTGEQQELLSCFKEKVARLMEMHKQLEDERKGYLQRIEELEVDLQQGNQQFLEIQQRYESLKMARTLAGQGDNPGETRKKINRLVREIDRCIALLNR